MCTPVSSCHPSFLASSYYISHGDQRWGLQNIEAAYPDITRYTKNSEQYARRLHDAIVKLLQSSTSHKFALKIMPDLIKGETLGVAPAVTE